MVTAGVFVGVGVTVAVGVIVGVIVGVGVRAGSAKVLKGTNTTMSPPKPIGILYRPGTEYVDEPSVRDRLKLLVSSGTLNTLLAYVLLSTAT